MSPDPLPTSSTGPLPSPARLSRRIRLSSTSILVIRNPMPKHGLGSFPFARRYLGNRCFFLFLRLLRCFSSPGCLRTVIHRCVLAVRYIRIAICGFPHSEICGSNGYVRLPAAYRSLSRPSSAPVAKASSMCSSSLDLSILVSLTLIFGKHRLRYYCIHSSQFRDVSCFLVSI